MVKTKEYLRFRWSHDHFLHRAFVRFYNFLMRLVPFSIKYAIGKYFRRNSPPYNLVTPGSIVVQVGAPSDTLLSGRSRAAFFCLFAGEKGKVIIVEPDQQSVKVFQSINQKYHLGNAIFAPYAVWSEKKTLTVHINPSHPASNFIDGTKTVDPELLAKYHHIEIPANTLDNILAEQHIEQVDLVSITTNGSEREIITGMIQTISRGVKYIALARTGNYKELMASLGYDLYTYDDRGFTFQQSKRLNVAEMRKIL